MTLPNDKIALVTGGSRGIGAAIVRRLAADGATVAFTYASAADRARLLADELEAAGARVLALRADSGDPDAVRGAVAATVEAFGRIDILVNSAGILVHKPLADTTLEDFERITAVNVRALFVATQAVLPHMGDGGRIVNIGSMAADRAGGPGAALYAMSKAAVAGLTRGLARDLGPRGITVNDVQPGPTETDIVADEGVRAYLRTQIPVGRMGRDSEIAGLVAYLVRPEAAFVNGAMLTIDGGFVA
ncbi:3-oxoacyl-ACP reductase family protein [uncultured Massilia sp.]|uniref:3-oxoacyl-ACP reductase family protein n=1 Tax=uncultured Massilia sp. TaxID=169973 RepID=UPI0025DBD65B|nr:3-oxoacyl-ACP reductase family protein [uncultured Massilia sp.]